MLSLNLQHDVHPKKPPIPSTHQLLTHPLNTPRFTPGPTAEFPMLCPLTCTGTPDLAAIDYSTPKLWRARCKAWRGSQLQRRPGHSLMAYAWQVEIHSPQHTHNCINLSQ